MTQYSFAHLHQPPLHELRQRILYCKVDPERQKRDITLSVSRPWCLFNARPCCCQNCTHSCGQALFNGSICSTSQTRHFLAELAKWKRQTGAKSPPPPTPAAATSGMQYLIKQLLVSHTSHANNEHTQTCSQRSPPGTVRTADPRPSLSCCSRGSAACVGTHAHRRFECIYG